MGLFQKERSVDDKISREYSSGMRLPRCSTTSCESLQFTFGFILAEFSLQRVNRPITETEIVMLMVLYKNASPSVLDRQYIGSAAAPPTTC